MHLRLVWMASFPVCMFGVSKCQDLQHITRMITLDLRVRGHHGTKKKCTVLPPCQGLVYYL